MGDFSIDPDEGGVCQMDDQAWLEKSLEVLKDEAFNFGKRFIQDSKVREEYLKAVKLFSEETLTAVSRGDIDASEAAKLTHAMRNEILELSRLKSSDIGLAQAQALKATGLGLDQLMEKYAQKLYKKAFSSLSEAEQRAVYLEIVQSAGRANPKVSIRAARLGIVGKAFWVFTAAVVVYKVTTADNKVEAAAQEGVGLAGGWAGGAAGGALAGLACGPGGSCLRHDRRLRRRCPRSGGR